MMHARGPLALLLLALALGEMLARRPAALANGVPLRVPLTYLAGLSNSGPADARGEAEISFAEGLIRVDVRGLPRLSGEVYQVWLAKSGTNRAVAVGSFNTGPDGLGGYSGRMAGLEGYDYDLVILTIEPQPDPDPAPSAKRSIGGFFTLIQKPEAGATAITADTRPAELPKTGDDPRAPAGPGGGRHAAALALLAAGGMMLLLAQRGRIRR
jgi:hypothetical protein